MDNDEIKALLRELKARSDASDEVKGKTIRITFGEEEPPVREESRGSSLFGRKKVQRSEETEERVPRKKKNIQKKETPPRTEQDEGAEEKHRTEQKEASQVVPDTGFQVKGEKTREEEIQAEQEKPVVEEARPEQEDLPKVSRKKLVAFPKPKPKKKNADDDPDFLDGDEEDFRESDALLLEARKNGAVGRGPWKNLKLAVWSYFDDLKAKGIGERELILIGAGVVLVIFLVFVIYSAIFSKDKSVNVVADEGLYVTVEEEPEAWCTSGTVTMSVRSGSIIQSVTVNGENVEIEQSKRVTVTVDADTEKLNLMVVTEESVLNAQVGIPMIDSKEPAIALGQENGQITMNAVDEGSGVEGIYYGTATGFSDVPYFRKYTGPFTYEEGKLYYYYAKDLAGNATSQMTTNMEPAQYLVLSESEVTLFPGDSVELTVSSSPKNTYFNNLQLINKNPEIVSLASDGTVTALKDGDAVIEASADGLPTVTCVIRVHSEAEFTLTAIGDCTLGDDVNFNPSNSFSTVYSMYGYDYFFKNVKSILAADDLTFANFEGTLTTSDAREGKEYAFKGAPEYTAILKDGSIEAVTLANNHSSDYGPQSLADTKQYLSDAGIAYCTGEEIIYKEVNGIKVALIGIYVLDTGIEKASQVESALSTAKQHGADVIVVGFHWGSERSNYPDETQQSLAHTAIDCGADLVVGHHPHVLQGIEQYQGKYIVYSLGNFCFGGNSNPSDTDTMIFQQTFSVNEGGEVTGSSINIIPCSITSQYGWNNYQPTPQEGTEAERIMGRINEYSAQFGLTFE